MSCSIQLVILEQSSSLCACIDLDALDLYKVDFCIGDPEPFLVLFLPLQMYTLTYDQAIVSYYKELLNIQPHSYLLSKSNNRSHQS